MSVVANQTDRLESHIAAACGLNDDVGCCAASKRPHRLGYTGTGRHHMIDSANLCQTPPTFDRVDADHARPKRAVALGGEIADHPKPVNHDPPALEPREGFCHDCGECHARHARRDGVERIDLLGHANDHILVRPHRIVGMPGKGEDAITQRPAVNAFADGMDPPNLGVTGSPRIGAPGTGLKHLPLRACKICQLRAGADEGLLAANQQRAGRRMVGHSFAAHIHLFHSAKNNISVVHIFLNYSLKNCWSKWKLIA